MKDSELVVVRNRNNGSTGYRLYDSNIRRRFSPNETKKIPLEELRALQYAPGGDYILKNLLIVENRGALEDLNMQVEPEYFYTEEKIKELLYKSEMDAFLDFLDFAPAGAIEIAKRIAVEERIPDSRKREAITKKTGFNIDNAINVNKVLEEEDEKEKKAAEAAKARRVKIEEKKEEAPAVPQRRTAVPETEVGVPKKYNVVSTKK